VVDEHLDKVLPLHVKELREAQREIEAQLNQVVLLDVELERHREIRLEVAI